jgi:hypothetical protein
LRCIFSSPMSGHIIRKIRKEKGSFLQSSLCSRSSLHTTR